MATIAAKRSPGMNEETGLLLFPTSYRVKVHPGSGPSRVKTEFLYLRADRVPASASVPYRQGLP